jgi:hypothetical protein
MELEYFFGLQSLIPDSCFVLLALISGIQSLIVAGNFISFGFDVSRFKDLQF